MNSKIIPLNFKDSVHLIPIAVHPSEYVFTSSIGDPQWFPLKSKKFYSLLDEPAKYNILWNSRDNSTFNKTAKYFAINITDWLNILGWL